MEKRLSTVIRRHCLVAHPPFFTEIKLSFNSEKYDSQCKYQSFINIDVIGQSMYNLIHPDDNQVFSEQFRITDVKGLYYI
ncbi:Hypothetical predicted protein [Octopus vulgaris]|uniref:Uncharacterized protein n=1 Tax=Octopus vulgaris TaxID=6645 RepID=A0AA36B202_OCTVU|nr:Hypothetical predicted protein [Octopus vulgaris]